MTPSGCSPTFADLTTEPDVMSTTLSAASFFVEMTLGSILTSVKVLRIRAALHHLYELVLRDAGFQITRASLVFLQRLDRVKILLVRGNCCRWLFKTFIDGAKIIVRVH